MWNYITGLVVIYVFIQLVEKILNIFRKNYGSSQSHRFSIDANFALIKNKKFLEMIGIKSGAEGKEYDSWTKTEKEKWDNFALNGGPQTVDITYLSSENSYYISSGISSGYFFLRDNENQIIYSKIIAGDKDGLDENIEFGIYEKSGGFMKHNAIVPFFRYSKRNDDTGGDFIPLCEFPNLPLMSDSKYMKLGFEVNRSGGNDWYEDDFKDGHAIPVSKTYKKNGVMFDFVF